MDIDPMMQWIAFALFAFIAVAGALGMTTTMSMFRSGIFLMASFIGVAGLFILLLADLLALLQVMMYIGGMLVMILYMLLFSGDPGGAMMASHMSLRGPERWFSAGLAHHADNDNAHRERGDGGESNNHAKGDDHGRSGHSDMSMFTAFKRPAAVLAVLVGTMLVALLLWRAEAWAAVERMPDQDSPRRIGHMLIGKYMIAFEGAGLLILLGIFGAVLVQRPAQHPDSSKRDELQAAVHEAPAPVELDALEPIVADLRPHADTQHGDSA